MKKLILTLVLLLAVSGAFADTDLDPDDLLYLSPGNAAIFPELDYSTNPAFLVNVKEKFMTGNIGFDTDWVTETKTRTDDSVGAAGGTETSSSFGLVPALDFAIFTPLESGKIFGFGMNYGSEHLLETVTDIKYNGSAEHLQSRLTDNAVSFGTDVYLAGRSSGKMYFGFLLGYDFSYDPAIFRWVTDSTVSPALIYTEPLAEQDVSNDFSHGWDTSFGMNFPTDKMEFRFAVDYDGSFTDSSDEYVEVDTDGDGFTDTVYKLYDYLDLPAGDGGPSDAVTGKDFVHYTFNNDVDLNAGMVWDFDSSKAMIIDGNWRPFGLSYNHYAKHVTTASIKTDNSFFDKYYNTGLGTFDVNLAFDFYDKSKKTTFRIGGGYARYAETLSQKGDTAAGLMVFSSQNTGNYTEMNLGLEPANNSLSASGLEPARQVVHSVMIDANWRWTPEKKVTLFLELGAAAWYGTSTYRAYNLDTRSVWEETDTSAGIDLLFDTAAGISFPMGENITCKVDLQNISTVGDFSFADETHMYDADLQRYSANADDFRLSGTNLDFSLDLSFQWRF